MQATSIRLSRYGKDDIEEMLRAALQDVIDDIDDSDYNDDMSSHEWERPKSRKRSRSDDDIEVVVPDAFVEFFEQSSESEEYESISSEEESSNSSCD